MPPRQQATPKLPPPRPACSSSASKLPLLALLLILIALLCPSVSAKPPKTPYRRDKGEGRSGAEPQQEAQREQQQHQQQQQQQQQQQLQEQRQPKQPKTPLTKPPPATEADGSSGARPIEDASKLEGGSEDVGPPLQQPNLPPEGQAPAQTQGQPGSLKGDGAKKKKAQGIDLSEWKKILSEAGIEVILSDEDQKGSDKGRKVHVVVKVKEAGDGSQTSELHRVAAMVLAEAEKIKGGLRTKTKVREGNTPFDQVYNGGGYRAKREGSSPPEGAPTPTSQEALPEPPPTTWSIPEHMYFLNALTLKGPEELEVVTSTIDPDNDPYFYLDEDPEEHWAQGKPPPAKNRTMQYWGRWKNKKEREYEAKERAKRKKKQQEREAEGATDGEAATGEADPTDPPFTNEGGDMFEEGALDPAVEVGGDGDLEVVMGEDEAETDFLDASGQLPQEIQEELMDEFENLDLPESEAE